MLVAYRRAALRAVIFACWLYCFTAHRYISAGYGNTILLVNTQYFALAFFLPCRTSHALIAARRATHTPGFACALVSKCRARLCANTNRIHRVFVGGHMQRFSAGMLPPTTVSVSCLRSYVVLVLGSLQLAEFDREGSLSAVDAFFETYGPFWQRVRAIAVRTRAMYED